MRAAQLRIEATSTLATGTISVYDTATGALIGILTNEGKGKYDATFQTQTVANITLRSTLGGSISGAVEQK